MSNALVEKIQEIALRFPPLLYGLAIALSIVIGGALFISNNTTHRAALPLQDNYIPQIKANFDKCEINSLWLSISGWALLDLPDNTIKIHLFATGPAGSIKLTTRRLYRKDVSDFLKIKSDYHLHGFSASGIRYKLQENFGTSVKLYLEDSKGVMHYGGENVCSAK
ncbi:hypothetical protein [Pseudomonas sp. GM80]|uniref:hypothetical protein n=1 Tax=Pseudomonas sp. GM80 TaxID=1144339 RepID=UPI00026FB71B|nr:hypothetical protein [Pseudomonas sp. GM80]EJN33188.1 hypothetical protein PMI37_01698 [Pseudomonas sp. GM80]